MKEVFKIKDLVKISEELNKLFVQSSKLGWVYYTTGYDFGITELRDKINEKFRSKEEFEIVKKYFEKIDLNATDKRKAEIMYDAYKYHHYSDEVNKLTEDISKLTNELSGILNNHRSKINGVEISSVELAQILSSSPDSEKRKQAYLARAQVNKPLVEGGFIELVKMRKELAKLLKFDNFVDFKLDDDGLTKDVFKDWKQQLHQMLPKMNESRSEVAKKFVKNDILMPWDEAYVSSKIAPSLNEKVDMSEYYSILRTFFLKFGVDISKYNITYDIFSRANKSEWGYNFPIDTAKDTRVLANVKNQFNEFGVLLHETGHAVHSYIKDPEEKILNMGISGIITEGIANLFGSLMYHEDFYGDILQDKNKAKEEFKLYKAYSKSNSLRAIASIMFDQNIYLNKLETINDINELVINTNRDYLKEEPVVEEYPWAYRIHHTTHPIYLHNYFMGDVTCEMLRKVFIEKLKCEEIMDKPVEFFEFLNDTVVKPSGLYKYPEMFRKISGDEFSLKYML